MTVTYEVHVSAQHWAEGCDRSLAGEVASQCCPVFRAMVEAGLPVYSTYPAGWHALEVFDFQPFPKGVRAAINEFDGWRAGEEGCGIPAPLTFYVELEA